jgi:DNA polymerase III sliding clamp (beta) subunit (PCNA family)/RNA polymerase-binding transcription factor DksA
MTKTAPYTERYGIEDLMEFKGVIDEKIEACEKELQYLQGLLIKFQDPAHAEELASEWSNIFHLQQIATRQEVFIARLQEALERIDNGTYGICRITGRLIPKARLLAVPHTTLLLEAKMGQIKPSDFKPKNTDMQKFTVNTNILKPALGILKEAIAAKPDLPILGNLLCRVSDTGIELVATNLQITIFERLQCDTEGAPFQVLLPFGFLAKIVALNAKSPLSFELKGKGVNITAVKEVYELKRLDNWEEFPKLPTLPVKNRVLLPNSFAYWLFAAMDIIDKSSQIYQYVLLELRENAITLASSDLNYRVFSYALDNEKHIDHPDDLLIPESAIKALSDTVEVNVSWTAKNIGFDNGARTIIVNRTEAKFGNYRQILPQNIEYNIELKRSEIIQALDNCCLNSDPFKTTVLHLGNKTAPQFRAYDKNYDRDIHVDVEGEYKGDVEKITFNADHMLSLMHQVEYEKISMSIYDERRPILFGTPEDPNYTGLLMTIHPIM